MHLTLIHKHFEINFGPKQRTANTTRNINEKSSKRDFCCARIRTDCEETSHHSRIMKCWTQYQNINKPATLLLIPKTAECSWNGNIKYMHAFEVWRLSQNWFKTIHKCKLEYFGSMPKMESNSHKVQTNQTAKWMKKCLHSTAIVWCSADESTWTHQRYVCREWDGYTEIGADVFDSSSDRFVKHEIGSIAPKICIYIRNTNCNTVSGYSQR